MKDLTLLTTLAFIFSALAYVPYVWSLSKSKARPTLSVWISWLVMDGAIFAAALAKDIFLYQVGAYVVGCIAIIGVSLYKNPTLGWTKLDTICTALVLAAVALWAMTGDANIAMLVSLAAMVIGSLPMYRNVWQDPSREPMLPWLLNWAGALCGVLAITEWSIAGALAALVFFALSTSFNIFVLRQLLPRKAVV